MAFARFLRPHKLEQNVSKNVHLGFRQCVKMPPDGQNVIETCNTRYFIEYNRTVVADGNLKFFVNYKTMESK